MSETISDEQLHYFESYKKHKALADERPKLLKIGNSWMVSLYKYIDYCPWVNKAKLEKDLEVLAREIELDAQSQADEYLESEGAHIEVENG